VFLVCNFLFTSSDTFAVGCIVWPKNAPKNEWVKRRIRLFRHMHTPCGVDEDNRVVKSAQFYWPHFRHVQGRDSAVNKLNFMNMKLALPPRQLLLYSYKSAVRFCTSYAVRSAFLAIATLFVLKTEIKPTFTFPYTILLVDNLTGKSVHFITFQSQSHSHINQQATCGSWNLTIGTPQSTQFGFRGSLPRPAPSPWSFVTQRIDCI